MTPAPRDTWLCDRRAIGRRVLVFESLPSTSDAALAIDEPGTVIVADAQTAGRGRNGRTWHSRPGASLSLSVVVAPTPLLQRPVIVTAWLAVAVAEAIFKLTARQANLKWPNDLLLDGRKVCGLLVERQRNVVAGIGLNLTQTTEDFTADGLPEATSLARATGVCVEPELAANIVLDSLDAGHARLQAGEASTLECLWKWRLGLLGRQVAVTRTDGAVVQGRLADMGFDGLELDAGDGRFDVLLPEYVQTMSSL